MLSRITSLFDYNQRQLNKLQKKGDAINAMEDNVRRYKDSEFLQKTQEFKEVLHSGERSLDDILPEAYALVREASRRVLKMRHFDVQMLAAIAMHEGKIVEQRTGEGKTLTATAPLYLNALSGKGVHLVTVNDYLARRDAGWMGKVFSFLGMKTAVIISDASFLYDPEFSDDSSIDWRLLHLRPISRKEAYDADITYGINSEFGFDYLRDNMTGNVKQLTQRGYNYAIIDEADSVLIDEARTPHIISAPSQDDVSMYYKYADVVRSLDKEKHIVIDEKLRTAHLTDEGVQAVEQILGIENMYEKDFDTLYYMEAAVKAEALFKKDKEYIVKGGEVVIVDEFTGRLLHGRRFSEGLHQAIEAKERVQIKQESKTLATVSLQNYFRMYDKLAGMTGTASTEAEEFNKIYSADVVVIPTHRSMVRNDHADVIYKTEKAKYQAVAKDIAVHHALGRPVLVGTTSIEKNELLSQFLKQEKVPHEMLNAKNHQREAEIIADAGKKGAVTVATNMAGRGVDIILGGAQPSIIDFQHDEKAYTKAIQSWEKVHEEVIKLGGLYVIGTERHESRRIDNQLRGRSGRQGDPGDTRFFVSLEDDLMRIFGGEQISRMMTFFNLPEDQPLSHNMVSKAIEQAQVKVEGHNFDIRKHLVEYDDVLNKQREIIYAKRRVVLTLGSGDLQKFENMVQEAFREVVAAQLTNFYIVKEQFDEEEQSATFAEELSLLFPVEKESIQPKLYNDTQEDVEAYLMERIKQAYAEKKDSVGQDMWLRIAQSIFLSIYDQFWTRHLTGIDDLRQGINLRGYGQLNPLIEYKNEAFRMFETLIQNITYEAVRRILHVQIDVQKSDELKQQSLPQQENKKMVLSSASGVDPYAGDKKQTPRRASSSSSGKTAEPKSKKPGRNDPCWCGSGKKYKKCHYPN